MKTQNAITCIRTKSNDMPSEGNEAIVEEN